jgi:AcrR family transcriptional regulator
MNKHESKYYNTASLMQEALISLLDKKEYEFISIKEICTKAGVNRSTFYLHYETLDDLLQETIESYMQKFYSSFDAKLDIEEIINTNQTQNLFLLTPKYLNKYLDFIRNNKKIFSISIRKPQLLNGYNIFNSMSESYFKPIMDYYKIDETIQPYLIRFHIDGIMSIIKQWLKDDCLLSNEYVIDIIDYCLDLKHLKEKFNQTK